MKNSTVMNYTSSVEETNFALTLPSPAFFMDEYLTSFQILFAAIGIPLNLLLVGFIIFLERLQSPRNLIWIGIGFSNIFILVGFVLEAIFSKMEPSQSWLCYNMIGGLPFGSLVINLHLSLFNRHVNLHYSSWHKRHVTNRLIVTTKIVCFILFFLIFKGHYFASNFSLREMLPIPEAIGSIIGILIVLVTSLFCNKTQTETSSDQHQVHYRTSLPNDQGTVKNAVEIHFVQIGNERVSRLDVEAGQGILFGAKISAAFTMPVVVLFAVFLICGCIYSD